MKNSHESANHPDDLVDYNLFASNASLVEALEREVPADARERLTALGARLGTRGMFALGDAANRNPPVLKVFDRFGHRRDEVEFHPAWHELMRALVSELNVYRWAGRMLIDAAHLRKRERLFDRVSRGEFRLSEDAA